jgi:hypothetical protein
VIHETVRNWSDRTVCSVCLPDYLRRTFVSDVFNPVTLSVLKNGTLYPVNACSCQ